MNFSLELSRKNVIFWLSGMLFSCLGIALCTKANYGLSMVSAIPYILHVWLRTTIPWFTQGMASYVFEAIVLFFTCLILKSFKLSYLLSFFTAFVAGGMIDLWFYILGGNGTYDIQEMRVAAFVIGICLNAFGIACYFRTTLPLEVYEMTVTQIAKKYNISQNKVKYGFDFFMLTLAIILARLLTNSWTGIGIGTLIVTCANTPLIKMWGDFLDNKILHNHYAAN